MPLARTAAETAGTRLAGGRPSRAKALAVSCVTGVGVGYLTYKLLRSGSDENE
jgi:hypothetical protein